MLTFPTTRPVAFSPPHFALTPNSALFSSRWSCKPVFRSGVTIRATDTSKPVNTTSYETGKIKTDIRVFVDESFITGQTVTLNASEIRHLRARRARDGHILLLFNSAGYSATAVLRKSDAIVLRVSKTQQQRPSITAIVGIPKSPSRADWVVEKLTELGVTCIAFSCTARTASRPTDAKIQRWHRLAVAAAKQCLRTEMPRICVLSFDHAVKEVERHTAPLLFCSGGQPMLAEECVTAVRSSSSALLLIGPEGGFDDVEIDALVQAGAIRVGLGDLRLRVETAAVVAAGVVSQLFVENNYFSEKELG